MLEFDACFGDGECQLAMSCSELGSRFRSGDFRCPGLAIGDAAVDWTKRPPFGLRQIARTSAASNNVVSLAPLD
jgi:hypothetical protein